MFRIVAKRNGKIIESYQCLQWEMALQYYDFLWEQYNSNDITVELYEMPNDSPIMYTY